MEEQIRKVMLDSIEASLQEYLDAYWGNEQSLFKEMISYHMGWQSGLPSKAKGKRIRPYLLLLMSAVSGNDWLKALPAAVSVEYLHNFTLIHDDIMDNSKLRHGQPSVWSKFNIPQAINAGDGLFNMSQWALYQIKSNYPQEITFRVLEIFNQTVAELIEGQILDIQFEEQSETTLDDYWRMITGKTGILIKACALIGACLGSLNDHFISLAGDFGLNLGLAFQVQDDLLGIWGDPVKTGKPIFNDLIEGKTSLPIVYALQNEANFKEAWINKNINLENARHYTTLLEEIGAKVFCQNKAKEFTQRAFLALDTIDLKRNPYMKLLQALTSSLLIREI